MCSPASGPCILVWQDKSQWLLAQAKAFHASAREQRRIVCWRYIKLSLIIGGVVSLAAGVGVVLLLSHLGILWPPHADPPGSPPSVPPINQSETNLSKDLR